MTHHAGMDLVLGTELMIPAGVRIDLFNSTAKLLVKLIVILIKSAKEVNEQ